MGSAGATSYTTELATHHRLNVGGSLTGQLQSTKAQSKKTHALPHRFPNRLHVGGPMSRKKTDKNAQGGFPNPPPTSEESQNADETNAFEVPLEDTLSPSK